MGATSELQLRDVYLHRAVAYMLACLPDRRLVGKRAALHRAFYDIATKHPDLLPGIAFSDRSSAPYSKTLERVLFGLASSRLIAYLNPSYEYMWMSPEASDRIKLKYGRELADKAADLEKAAEILATQLAV